MAKASASQNRTPLTPKRITEAALDLIDAGGLEAFSMRKLGAAMGVEPMALYHHMPSKDAVLDSVTEALLLEAAPPTADPADWRAWMRELGRGYMAVAKAHPKAFILLAARRFNTPASFAWFERSLSVLHAAGFSARGSARAFRAMGAVVNGAGLAYAATVEGSGRSLLLDDFPFADRYPHVAAAAPHLALAAQDDLMSFALEAILAGLEPATA
jgi:AcrR family transcriptional regulator